MVIIKEGIGRHNIEKRSILKLKYIHFIQENIDVLNTRYGSGHLMTSLVKGVTEQFHQDSDVDNIQQFFKVENITSA